MEDKQFRLVLAVLTLLLFAAGFLSVVLGQVRIPLSEIVKAISSEGGSFRSIIINIRIPRFLLAASVGAMLSVSGLILQTVFRNPLVDPYFLGVSSAAELGASVAIVFGFGVSLFGFSMISVFAFLFSLLLVLFLVRVVRLVHVEYSRIAIVLIGIAISYVLSAVNTLLVSLKRNVFLESTFWGMRGFNGATLTQFYFSLPFLIAGIIFVFINAKRMNIFLSSDLTAHSLGINVKHFICLMLCVAALLSSISVVLSGTIIFVGLFIPHLGRMIVGEDRRKLSITTLFLGAILLPVFDLFARVILPSQEVPVNTIASLIGAPFFIFLFFKRGNNVLFKN
jgi:iron complex transport system permease protein